MIFNFNGVLIVIDIRDYAVYVSHQDKNTIYIS